MTEIWNIAVNLKTIGEWSCAPLGVYIMEILIELIEKCVSSANLINQKDHNCSLVLPLVDNVKIMIKRAWILKKNRKMKCAKIIFSK